LTMLVKGNGLECIITEWWRKCPACLSKIPVLNLSLQSSQESRHHNQWCRLCSDGHKFQSR
jgi:hypothetical protein